MCVDLVSRASDTLGFQLRANHTLKRRMTVGSVLTDEGVTQVRLSVWVEGWRGPHSATIEHYYHPLHSQPFLTSSNHQKTRLSSKVEQHSMPILLAYVSMLGCPG